MAAREVGAPAGIVDRVYSATFSALSAMPDRLESTIGAFPASRLRYTPASWDGIPGERFSPVGQICHLRDIEIDGYHVRFRRMLAEDAPSLVSLDGTQLAEERDYASADPEAALAAFRSARATTLELLAGVTPAQLARRGDFAEYGSITLHALVHYLSSHDYQHLACLDWLLGKLHSEG